MSKQDPERRLELSPAQVAGSALAAMSGAAVISWAGTAGTLIGAAAGSVIATVGAATYTYSLRRTRDAALRTAARVRQTALAANALPRTVADGPLRDEETPEAHEPKPSLVRRWDLPWGKLALVSLAVMIVGMAGITAIEAATGRPVSSYTGGGGSATTTLGSIAGSDHQGTTTKAKKPANDTPRQQGTPADHAGPTEAPVPTPTQPAAPAPSPDPTPTPTEPPASPEPDPGLDGGQ